MQNMSNFSWTTTTTAAAACKGIARKFAHEGYTVAILSRDLGRLSRLAEEIAREEKGEDQVFAMGMDCSDTKSTIEAFEVEGGSFSWFCSSFGL